MSKLVRLPGLIDIHVHLRDPGQIQKEDFYTGTCAALAGGVTTVFDMPNNITPIVTNTLLEGKLNIAKKKALCDYALYFGTNGRNIDEFRQVKDKVVGLKLYLNITNTNILVEDQRLIENVFQSWPKDKVIVIHAEGDKIDLAIELSRKYKNRIHVTHVATKRDLEKILFAKSAKLRVTCDVTPHHLFLTVDDEVYLDGFGKVKPNLATQSDVDFLWDNIAGIDCITTDHAPHTVKEKKSFDPPFGVPGLETMLPLLITAVKQKRLTIDEIIRLTNTNPQEIFNFKQDNNTYIDVDVEEEYRIDNKKLFTKCGWSPFHGRSVYGKVVSVYLRGKKVFGNGKTLVSAGFGKNIIDQ